MTDKSPEAAIPQPPPKKGSVDIYPLVLADIEARVKAGRQKYGIPLQAHNGRNALMDLYQEQIDALMYTRQELEERQKNDKLIERIGILILENRDFFGGTPANDVETLQLAADKLEQVINAVKGVIK